MTDIKLVNPVNLKDLPVELVEALKGVAIDAPYTAKDSIMSFMAHHGKATVDDLMIYVYRMTGNVISRRYLYQALYLLRQDGLGEEGEFDDEHGKVFRLTELGRERARPYQHAEVEKHGTG